MRKRGLFSHVDVGFCAIWCHAFKRSSDVCKQTWKTCFWGSPQRCELKVTLDSQFQVNVYLNLPIIIRVILFMAIFALQDRSKNEYGKAICVLQVTFLSYNIIGTTPITHFINCVYEWSTRCLILLVCYVSWVWVNLFWDLPVHSDYVFINLGLAIVYRSTNYLFL